MKQFLLLGYLTALFGGGMVVTAQNQNSLHKDREIEGIASKLGVDKIKTVGNLLELSKENALQIKADQALRWEELIAACLLSEDKMAFVEGTGFMALSLERFQVSQSYDLILLTTAAGPPGSDGTFWRPRLVFFVPHREMPYGIPFIANPTSEWDKIEFTAPP